MKKIIIIAIALIFTYSCKKESGNPPENSIKEIIVDKAFTWETSHLFNFTITKATSGVISITGEDGHPVYFKGFYNGLTEQFPVSVRIPSNIIKVMVNEQLMELTANEITVNLNEKSTHILKDGNNTRGIVSHWPMNENSGTVLNDQNGGNNGTIHGATWQPGVEGTALDFNGTNSWVEIPERPNLDITAAITLSAWVMTRENKTMKIAQKGDWDGYGMGQSKWTGWNCFIRMADNTENSLYWGQGIPLVNVWYFLAMTYDGSTMKFYVNGQLKASKPVTGLLNNNARPFCIGSDGGAQKFCYGMIDDVNLYNHALTVEEILDLYNFFPNDDGDGDGVLNQDDDYPTDPLRAFNNYTPAAGLGSLAFEDLWPNQGDYDFNDLVLDYQFKTVTNANNFITEVYGEFSVKAIGAGYKNGFGFQLNQKIPSENIQVSGINLTENYVSLDQNGTESNQALTTLIIFDNVSKILASQGGTGVNVDHNYPRVEPDTTIITIDFIDNTYNLSQIALETWNPFLIVNGDREIEVHLANHPPTSLANTSYLGTSDDHSVPNQGIYYKTVNNLPWAIELPVSFDYPVEKMIISDAHLKFVSWALSSGDDFTDWYLNLPGYRELAKIY